MNAGFEAKIINSAFVDTRTYRYRLFSGSRIGGNSSCIKRIALDALDTTAALSDKSETNPDGWEVLTIYA